MKFRSLLFSGALVAIVGIAAAGCNSNPVTSIGNNPTAASNLRAVSLSATSVGLTWTASSDTGAITYDVAYKGALSGDSAMVPVSGTSATVGSLLAGQSYTFYVRAVRSGLESGAAIVTWAPATRYDATTIKVYEKTATGPSGLSLDAIAGGPQAVSVKSGTAANVQFAMNVDPSIAGAFDIGPASAFPEYAAADKFDITAFVSDSNFLATSLDTWYSSTPIESRIVHNNGVAYTINDAGTIGVGFFARTGSSSLHYARVFIKSVGGQLLQGTAPNRFVELTVSYQATPGLAYAKAAGLKDSPAGGAAHRLQR